MLLLHDDGQRAVVGVVQARGAVTDRVAADRVGDEVEVGVSYIVTDQNAPTGGVRSNRNLYWWRPLSCRRRRPRRHRVGGVVAVVAPQPAAGCAGAQQIPVLGLSLELPAGVVEGGDLEEVEVVVEDVIGEVPAVVERGSGHGVNSAQS